jgi:hypothetical protein
VTILTGIGPIVNAGPNTASDWVTIELPRLVSKGGGIGMTARYRVVLAALAALGFAALNGGWSWY